MTQHRAFNGDRFLDRFQGSEDLLRNYAGIWGDGLNVNVRSLDIAAFKDFILAGDGAVKDQFMEGLYRAYDLCTERGHEDLFAACQCQQKPYDPDPVGTLPVECLSLKVRTENENAFNLAYERCTLHHAENFSVFQGQAKRAILNLPAATQRLQEHLSTLFKGDKNSDGVVVRQYQTGPYTSFIVYHAKRAKAMLVFEGPSAHVTVATTVFRPAQQDFIGYNAETGQIEIGARFEKEETSLRKTFAECCFGDAELFEKPESAARFSLAAIAAADFALEVDEGDFATLVELHFTLRQKHGPALVVRSNNVLETLELNGMRHELSSATITRAAFRIGFRDDGRGKRVELSGANKISFERATHAEDIFRYLGRWRVLRA
jgi:hypothetical protein